MVAQPYIPRSSPTYVVSSILGEAINQLQELLVVSAVPSAWPPHLGQECRAVRRRSCDHPIPKSFIHLHLVFRVRSIRLNVPNKHRVLGGDM